jgi:predicted lysophospholipase L1 biosynthesis ABC-type transport system permease subunit
VEALMLRSNVVWASFTLVILTLSGLFTVYEAMFAVWMTAYPYANASQWRPRVYLWLLTTIVIGVLCGVLVVWLVRRRRIGKASA